MKHYFLIVFALMHFVGLSQPKLTIQKPHNTDLAFVVQFRDNGKQFVTGSYEDKELKLWDLKTQSILRTFSGMAYEMDAFGINEENGLLIALDGNNFIYHWDINTGELKNNYLVKYEDNGLIENSMWYPSATRDGRYFVGGSMGGSLIKFDALSAKKVASARVKIKGSKGVIYSSSSISPDEQKIAIYGLGKNEGYSRYSAIIYDFNTFKPIKGTDDPFSKVEMIFLNESDMVIGGRKIVSLSTGEITEVGVSFEKGSKISQDGQYIVDLDNQLNMYETAEILDGNYLPAVTYDSPHKFCSIDISRDNKLLIAGLSEAVDNQIFQIFDLKTGRPLNSKGLKRNDIHHFDFNTQFKLLATGSEDGFLRVWNLRNASPILINHLGKPIIQVAISPDGKFAAAGSKEDITVFDLSLKRMIWREKVRIFKSNTQSVQFNAKNELVIVSWDKVITTPAERFQPTEKPNRHEERENALFLQDAYLAGICDEGNVLLNIYKDEEAKKLDNGYPMTLFATSRHDGEVLFKMPVQWKKDYYNSKPDYHNDAQAIALSRDLSRLAITRFIHRSDNPQHQEKNIFVYDTKTGDEIGNWWNGSRNGYSIALSANNQLVATSDVRNHITVWDIETKKKTIELTGHDGEIGKLMFIDDDTRLISCSKDGTIRIWHLESGINQIILTAFQEEYAFIDDEGYYRSSKNSHQYITFSEGDNVYTFENFDLKSNRPDLVVEELNYSSGSQAQVYKNAWLKRIKKMGFTEDQLQGKLNLPEVAITSEHPLASDSRQIELTIQASEKVGTLDRINVYINDVPIFGAKGLSVAEESKKELTRTVPIELSSGDNKIQVSVHNSGGLESVKETIRVRYQGTENPNTYVVSIGISDYQNDEFDLNYAAKDANDIAAKFGTDASKVFSITDGDAVKEKILAIKSELMKSKVDDRVILFVAGHGLLDDNLDYYIGMHDVDFENPAKRGLPYEQLEGLLDGIPARKKLMFIDACHSGEVDKDDAVLVASNETNAGIISARGFKTVASKSNSLGLANSFELMQELFADLRKGTGAVVISSASGAEFALESDAWKNGVFTYSILEGLENRKCDTDKDGAVQVSELKDYVFDRVAELTNGKQHPTSRRENLEHDFVVW